MRWWPVSSRPHAEPFHGLLWGVTSGGVSSEHEGVEPVRSPRDDRGRALARRHRAGQGSDHARGLGVRPLGLDQIAAQARRLSIADIADTSPRPYSPQTLPRGVGVRFQQIRNC